MRGAIPVGTVRTWSAAVPRPYKDGGFAERLHQDATAGRSEPRPYKGATGVIEVRTSSFFDVAVDHFGGVAALGKSFADRLSEHHGSMAAAGAAERDCQVALPFA